MFGRTVYISLWALVGVAKTTALVLFLTAADSHWPQAVAMLLLAFALVVVALRWRTHMLG